MVGGHRLARYLQGLKRHPNGWGLIVIQAMEREPRQLSILLHYAELGLKGKNQPQFRRRLCENIRLKLKTLGLNWRIEDAMGLLVAHIPDADAGRPIEPVLQTLREIFGIAWLTCARRLPHRRFTVESQAADYAALQRQLLALATEQFVPDKSFAVRVNRGDKALPFTSTELEAQLGRFIRQNTGWDRVDLVRPDVTFHLDTRHDVTYFFSDRLKGPGGLPVGTAGRVLALLSGGIDSPVAAWLMARRGCTVDFLHFTAASMSAEEARAGKVWRLAQRLSDYTLGSRLYLVPYTYFDLALLRAQADHELVLFRRFMARVAEQLACRLKAQALVTGDNLSQVASQTLSNLVATSRATEMSLLRPLLGYDKEEIMALAKQIGTYAISIEPYKDCCALISRHPKTRSRHEQLVELETRFFPDYQKLVEETLAEALCLEAIPVGRPAAEPHTAAGALPSVRR